MDGHGLYAKYVNEVKCGRDIYEIPSIGFIAYYRHPDQIYIEDTYVIPEIRKGGEMFLKLFNHVVALAKKHSIDTLSHSIVKKHSGFDKMEKRTLRFGFVKIGENATECFYTKGLNNG